MSEVTQLQSVAPQTAVTERQQSVAQAWLELRPENIKEAISYCEYLCQAAVVPKHFLNRPHDVFGAILAGSELGLKPMQSLQGMADINGTYKAFGTTAAAIIQGHHEFVDQQDTFDEATQTATVSMVRRGREPVTISFSAEQAKAAGLAGRNTYKAYFRDMLYWRAWHRCVTRLFPDVAHGLAESAPKEIEAGYSKTFEAPSAPDRRITKAAKANEALAARLAAHEPIEQESQQYLKAVESLHACTTRAAFKKLCLALSEQTWTEEEHDGLREEMKVVSKGLPAAKPKPVASEPTEEEAKQIILDMIEADPVLKRWHENITFAIAQSDRAAGMKMLDEIIELTDEQKDLIRGVL
jgi:hypothetical protein